MRNTPVQSNHGRNFGQLRTSCKLAKKTGQVAGPEESIFAKVYCTENVAVLLALPVPVIVPVTVTV